MKRALIILFLLLMVTPVWAGGLKMQLLRSYTSAPGDNDPNTDSIAITNSSVYYSSQGFLVGYNHSATGGEPDCDIEPWVYDATSGLWWSLAAQNEVARRNLYQFSTFEQYYIYFQVDDCSTSASPTINGANPIQLYVIRVATP